MDPSIMRLLEEDEDEHMHPEADIEALTAALRRDIGGAYIPAVHTTAPDYGTLSHGDQPPPALSIRNWQQSKKDHGNQQMQMQEETHQQQIRVTHSHEMDQLKHGGASEHLEDKGSLHSSEGDHLLTHCKKVQEHEQSSQLDENQQHPEDIQVQVPMQALGHGSEKVALQKTEQYPLSSHAQQVPIDFSNSQLCSLGGQLPSVIGQLKSPSQQPNQSSICFAHLIPMMLPHLVKDRAMQLNAIFGRLRKNEISKEDFLRMARGIVGDRMLRKAVQMLQERQHMQLESRSLRNAHSVQPKYPFQYPDSPQQSTNSGYSRQQISESQPLSNFQHLTQNASQEVSHDHQSQLPNLVSSNQVSSANTTPISQEWGKSSKVLPLGYSQRQPQQHLQFSRTPFSIGGGAIANYDSYGFSTSSVNAQAAPKLQGQESQEKPMTHAQGITSELPSGQHNVKNIPKHDMPNARNETKGLHGTSHLQVSNMTPFQPIPSVWQTAPAKHGRGSGLSGAAYVKQETTDRTMDHSDKSLMPFHHSFYNPVNNNSGKGHGPIKDGTVGNQPGRITANQYSIPFPAHLEQAGQVSSTPISINASTSKTSTKKVSTVQKKPLEAVASPTQVPAKKQRTSGEYKDQTIEQLNDVTAVSGVNLWEEEDQLLSASKEESPASEAMRRVVREEEERLILQRGPLQRKLTQIMARTGIKNAGSDVDRCLSMCVEERLRGLMSKLIRTSKQRADVEKGLNRVVVTSDVRRQILLINRKTKEELDRRQVDEDEKHRRQNEAEGSAAGDAEKDEGPVKSVKAHKGDDKMLTTTANMAARAAVGGDDVLSKWQLMSGVDGASGNFASKDLHSKTLPISMKTVSSDNQADSRPSPRASYGGVQAFDRYSISRISTKVARTISIKDLISLLEKEPQMAMSTLLYRLYLWSQEDASERAKGTS